MREEDGGIGPDANSALSRAHGCLSPDRADLGTLRRRAKKLYGGNLSAAIAEAARRIREEEGREALVAWLGDAAQVTPEGTRHGDASGEATCEALQVTKVAKV